MVNKININDSDAWANINWDNKPVPDLLKRTDHQVAVARFNRINKKGKKLNFSADGKKAHAENSRKVAAKRLYNHTIYQGTCKKTGKKIVLDIHGLRQNGFNPNNISRVVHGHKKSHKGYYWQILSQEKRRNDK